MEFLGYAADIFSIANFSAMLLGVCVGLIIGAIPGLNPPMAIALLIPVSFQFPPETAIILLVSCFAAGIYGGSFSAILLRAPGTSASAASTIEGFEMTKNGQAIEAIRISTFASVVGGLLSGLALMFLAPPLARFSLLFGPAEFFLIALLGLLSIAAVSFGALFRGLLAGMAGLLLATFGTDLASGFPRYTFGYIGFQAGFDILPAIVGLFAFAQGLELISKDTKGTISGVSKLSWNIWPSLPEMWKLRWSLVRGWVTGLVMGIIPAAGASVAQWVAYAWEVSSAKPGDKFGKGEPKGLAATEGSNNGVTGTSLIPMFVLGIPGGISAAVIFGALMIHGLQPGMQLFTARPEVIYTIMWGFLFANILMGGVAAVVARMIAYLTLIPRGIIGPLILIFSVVGVYAGTNNIHNVWIMVGFGVVGYYAQRFNFSPAALLLGLILGPIAENGFRNLMTITNNNPVPYIMGRPIALVILACILFALYVAFRPRVLQKAVKAGPPVTDGTDAGDPDGDRR
ncbi:tripartite tricarboxylate transporter permease [Pelagibacterium montanilacus]|uniref:tripartite tricarboxylate transporter permease n=1 Tax=Pelagibacterium montanilacus TaxID=2185280 RepID=UPI000F8F2F99|nr:tripartite tricarboxylate transporter permease [Pelagibacterium montanilacus]